MVIVASQNNTIVEEENLPLPVVLYPGFYGAFFGFKESHYSDKILFCSCIRSSIINYIKHKLHQDFHGYDDRGKKFFLNYGEFPQAFIDNIKHLDENLDIINYFDFKDKICHRCNLKKPSLQYCVAMYGSGFKQNYGRYIKEQSYKWGIIGDELNPELCPREIMDLLQITPKEYKQSIQEMGHSKNISLNQQIGNEYQKQYRKIFNIVENKSRDDFGFKKIGESWINETILFYIIKDIYPDKNILHHYRPDFLDGLELDVFIEELNIGIEYQGIQHYKPINHRGGLEALEGVKARDLKKKKLCASLNIRLICIKYDEILSKELLIKKLEL